MKRLWLSVDWDFFQFEDPAWEWGHIENHPHQDLIWLSRVEAAHVTSPDRFEPKASTFWSRFSELKFNLDLAALADSHGAALSAFSLLGDEAEPADLLVNIDAHHDLGYFNVNQLVDNAGLGRAEAGSWVYSLLHRYPRMEYLFVHPEWKDPTDECAPWSYEHVGTRKSARAVNAQITGRARATSALDFFSKLHLLNDYEVTGLFLAKSTAWSPPWNDGAFERFIVEAEDRFEFAFEGESPINRSHKWSTSGLASLQQAFQNLRRPSNHG